MDLPMAVLPLCGTQSQQPHVATHQGKLVALIQLLVIPRNPPHHTLCDHISKQPRGGTFSLHFLSCIWSPPPVSLLFLDHDHSVQTIQLPGILSPCPIPHCHWAQSNLNRWSLAEVVHCTPTEDQRTQTFTLTTTIRPDFGQQILQHAGPQSMCKEAPGTTQPPLHCVNCFCECQECLRAGPSKKCDHDFSMWISLTWLSFWMRWPWMQSRTNFVRLSTSALLTSIQSPLCFSLSFPVPSKWFCGLEKRS